MMRKMGMALSNTLMDQPMRDSFVIIAKMGKELFNGQMGKFTMDSGWTT